MPRFIDFGARLGLAVLLGAPSLGQASAPAPSVPRASASGEKTDNAARVEHIAVRESDGARDALIVEIQTSGAPVAPETQMITGPERIVVDFPGAIPAAELRALRVNRGALKGIRSGLFFSNPPITRVVLDLEKPQSYRISAAGNTVVVSLNGAKPNQDKQNQYKQASAQSDAASVAVVRPLAIAPAARPAAKMTNASLVASATAETRVAPAISRALTPAESQPSLPAVTVEPQPKPLVSVTFAKGMLSLHVRNATLAQVLFEVQIQTDADIAIPAGAEQEQVAADLGPAPARDVLAELLNGSHYNFVFVGNEGSLERVILTRRD